MMTYLHVLVHLFPFLYSCTRSLVRVLGTRVLVHLYFILCIYIPLITEHLVLSYTYFLNLINSPIYHSTFTHKTPQNSQNAIKSSILLRINNGDLEHICT